MHELSIATELYRLCVREREARDAGALLEVYVDCGELSAVEPDLLRFAWQAVVEGGPDEGAVLHVRFCPARQVCTTCGEVAERQPGSWMRLCPTCSLPLRLEGGDELDLVRVTLQESPLPQESIP